MIRVFFAVILAVLVDFFGGAAFPAGRWYFGFALILFLARQRRLNAAFGASAVYGLSLDVLHPAFPFGTFTLTHVALAAALTGAGARSVGVGSKWLYAAAFFAVFGYALFLEFAIQAASGMFGGSSCVPRAPRICPQAVFYQENGDMTHFKNVKWVMSPFSFTYGAQPVCRNRQRQHHPRQPPVWVSF